MGVASNSLVANWTRFAASALICLLATEVRAASDEYKQFFSAHQQKTLTNDPDTNPGLAGFLEKLDDPAAEAIRIGNLAYLAMLSCAEVKGDTTRIIDFVKRNVDGLSKDRIEDAKFAAKHTLEYLDYVQVAQLCASIPYMFGPAGHLLPNAVTAGTGEMILAPYRSALPANPYLILPR